MMILLVVYFASAFISMIAILNTVDNNILVNYYHMDKGDYILIGFIISLVPIVNTILSINYLKTIK